MLCFKLGVLTIYDEVLTMAYNLAEVLEQYVDGIQIVGTTDLGQYVSDKLADAYPRLSRELPRVSPAGSTRGVTCGKLS